MGRKQVLFIVFRIFRCASISRFEVVSKWVIYRFRLVHLRVFQIFLFFKKMMTKVREGGQGIGPLIGLLPQADRLQHRHHHVVLLLHNRQRYLEV